MAISLQKVFLLWRKERQIQAQARGILQLIVHHIVFLVIT